MAKNKDTEIRTLELMLGIYCRARHGGGLCPGCRDLLEEGSRRLRLCVRDPKPACKDCPSSCWPPALRAKLQEVMRFAGPRMPLRHPLLTLKHYLKNF